MSTTQKSRFVEVEKIIARSLDPLTRRAHWALRIALASVFLFHGLSKFSKLSGFAEAMGLPVFVALLVACAEVGGALLILFGGPRGGALGSLATRLAALAFIPVLIGSIAIVHWPRWSFTPSGSHPMGGMEFQVTLGPVDVSS